MTINNFCRGMRSAVTGLYLLAAACANEINTGKVYAKIHEPAEHFAVTTTVPHRSCTPRGMARSCKTTWTSTVVNICDDEDWILRLVNYNWKDRKFDLSDIYVSRDVFDRTIVGDLYNSAHGQKGDNNEVSAP